MDVYADIALSVPSTKSFQYSVPEHLIQKIRPGVRVYVRMRYRRMAGTVIGLSASRIVEDVKAIDPVVDEKPALDENMLELTC